MLLLQQKVTEEAWLVKEKLRVEVENGQVDDLYSYLQKLFFVQKW